jgi:hypothetical protein
MPDFPRSLIDFQHRFPDETACAAWLFEARWPAGFRCPACAHEKGWPHGGKRFTFECAACGKQTSVTAGTILHGSKLSLRDSSSRVLCSINIACCSALLIGTKRIPGRDIASQIASASTASFSAILNGGSWVENLGFPGLGFLIQGRGADSRPPPDRAA